MSTAQSLLPEFDQEMASTRRTLERIPEDKFEWKPAEKSMTMGQLANHIADMTGWMKEALEEDGFDVPADYKPFVATNRQELLKKFDEAVARARPALEHLSDAKLGDEWTLTMAGQTIFTMPRAAVLRSMILSHIIHHRAQLTVYYRLNGVAVPALYGPSGDEQGAAAGA